MSLKNRIDFVAFLSVSGANPNGDPLSWNMPRVDRLGHGEMSAECVKRKLRNRMQDMGHKICVQSNDRSDDAYTSIQARVEGTIGKAGKDQDAYKKAACEAFLDVRTFGQVLAWGTGKKDGSGTSVPVRGCVSIDTARTVDPVVIESMQITKSVNGTDSEKRGHDTMGMRHFVEFGLYRVQGSINVDMAARTGFSDEDAEVLKEALRTLFVNDESSARPSGTMEVVKVFWFVHDCPGGSVNSANVFRAVHADPVDEDAVPEAAGDYRIYVDDVPGVSVEVLG